MNWCLSHRAQPRAVAIADRHYNRQKPGTSQFVPPSTCVVFTTLDADAVWVTTHPKAQYTKHAWAGAWVNTTFRNEAQPRLLSSDLILEAVAATRWLWPDVPLLGMVTFVDASKVRHKRDPGRCYRKAGFRHVGYTKGGLMTWQLLREEMPEPEPPIGVTLPMELEMIA